MTYYFRTPGGRIEHLADIDRRHTRCGIPTRPGALFTDKDRGPDAKIRPLCERCRAAHWGLHGYRAGQS